MENEISKNSISDYSQNRSSNMNLVSKTSNNRVVSIDNFDSMSSKSKIKINSPRSVAAMKQLGYTTDDLRYQSFKEFLHSNPNLVGVSKEMKKNRYEYIENLRQEKIKEIKERRDKIDLATLGNKSRSKSMSKSRPSTAMNNDFQSTAIENERKAFERMKAKNEMELVGMVQYELTRELMRKKAEEKVQQEREQAEKRQREIMKIRREEENQKREKEREALMKQKQLEDEQKRMDQERYKEEMNKAKEEQKRERQRMREAAEKQREEEKRRLEFQMKVNGMLEENRRRIEAKQKELAEKEKERKKLMERMERVKFLFS